VYQCLDVADGEIAERRHESPFEKQFWRVFASGLAAICSPIVTAASIAARGARSHGGRG
jgi:hypothetical protein